MIIALLVTASILTTVPDLSSQVPAAYEINAYLDDSAHTVSGTLNLKFTNPTSRDIDTIAFHLYPNAFSDTASVFCREDDYAKNAVKGGNRSKLDITFILINNQVIEPGEYKIDGTRLYIPLKKPLRPGRSIDISLDFETLIPKIIGHFGYDSDGDYLVAHCLPILCGYRKGRLIDHEYHANSEFFSNFSYYDVTLELPADFKVVSSGLLSKESETDSTAVWQAFADTVIDFAFVCGPDFLEYESDYNGIKLRYLVKERHEEYYPVIDSTVKGSLQFCGDYLFPYPYESFSFADVGFTDAGLELPGMIEATIYGPGKDLIITYLKETIAHEIAHQWFYAAIATNEFEEPWLDEGFATFMEFKMAQEFGFDKTSVLFSNYFYSDRTSSRFFALLDEGRYPVNLKSWEYPDQQSYFSTVYGRGAMVLQALENMLGDSTFAASIKEYAQTYKFQHPDIDDFVASISKSSSRDLTDFVRMFIDGTARVDYAVQSLKFEKNKTENDSIDAGYTAYVEVARKLDGILPQKITLGLKDGTTIVKDWDGIDRVKKIEFETGSVPVYASISGEKAYQIDENINNNTFYLEGHITRMISFEWDTIFIIEFLASIFL